MLKGKVLAGALVFAVAVVPAAAQKKKPKQEPVPYPPPFETSAPTMATPDKPLDESTTWEADTSNRAGMTGVADVTLRDVTEKYDRLLPGHSYLIEGLRVGSVTTAPGQEGWYFVDLSEPSTGAYASGRGSGLTFVMESAELRAALDEQPALRRVPVRVRFLWERTRFLGEYIAIIHSLEFIDKDGRTRLVIH